MKFFGLFFAIAIAASAAPSVAQTRYAAPPAATLSGDLASPWILQLKNKPTPDGRYAVEVARPLPPARAQLRRTISAFTPLAADPARRERRAAKPASLRQPEAPAKARRAAREFDPQFEMQIVAYDTGQPAGTVIIDTDARFLYLVEGDGTARRYGIGVGRDGFQWSGTEKISRKSEWPGWTPPPQMIEREAKRGKKLPAFMEGGPDNPLGARALYLGDTLYRIHGTNQPWTIGKAVSSGCIRMRNEDVIDLYERVGVGTKVVVS